MSIENETQNNNKLKSHFTNGYVKTIPEKPIDNVNSGRKVEEYEETPLAIALLCYLHYAILIMFGHLRDLLRKIKVEKNRCAQEKNREGYVPLYRSFESFYTRNIYKRVCRGWNIPICTIPASYIDVLDRETDDYNWTFRIPGTKKTAINLGSYNYLGFAENKGPRTDSVEEVIKCNGVSVGSTRHELGSLVIHRELENLVAKFLKVEDSIVIGMGFATNSTIIPTLASKGSLILSDELNHASLVLGCRLSGAVIKVFKHNDMKDLEAKLREGIIKGHPKSRRPWKKILIVVEGIYSMEGTIVNLPEIVRLKNKYKAHLYLDEAHSIGAIGPNGVGVTDYYKIDSKEVDVLMGTFTKSFGAAGGYIAGSSKLIDHIRITSHGSCYGASMSPAVAQQIISVMKTITGIENAQDGRHRIQQLARNSKYFRQKLKQLGFIVYGNDDSPVVPMLMYFPGKIEAFVRRGITMGVCAVGAGFPATPLIESRVRFCLSAAHTQEMLDHVLSVCDRLGDQLALKYSRRKRSIQLVQY